MQRGGYQTQFPFYLTTATGESVRFVAYLIQQRMPHGNIYDHRELHRSMWEGTFPRGPTFGGCVGAYTYLGIAPIKVRPTMNVCQRPFIQDHHRRRVQQTMYRNRIALITGESATLHDSILAVGDSNQLSQVARLA